MVQGVPFGLRRNGSSQVQAGVRKSRRKTFLGGMRAIRKHVCCHPSRGASPFVWQVTISDVPWVLTRR